MKGPEQGCRRCHDGIITSGDKELIIRRAWIKSQGAFTLSAFICDACSNSLAGRYGLKPESMKDYDFVNSELESCLVKAYGMANKLDDSFRHEAEATLKRYWAKQEEMLFGILKRVETDPDALSTILVDAFNAIHTRLFGKPTYAVVSTNLEAALRMAMQGKEIRRDGSLV